MFSGRETVRLAVRAPRQYAMSWFLRGADQCSLDTD